MLAKNIVEAVMSDLNGRRGYGQLWDSIDEDVQAELVESLEKIVQAQIDIAETDRLERQRIEP